MCLAVRPAQDLGRQREAGVRVQDPRAASESVRAACISVSTGSESAPDRRAFGHRQEAGCPLPILVYLVPLPAGQVLLGHLVEQLGWVRWTGSDHVAECCRVRQAERGTAGGARVGSRPGVADWQPVITAWPSMTIR